MKISSTQLGTFTSLTGQPLGLPGSGLVHPLSVLLFGKRRARRLDPRKFPKLKKALRKLAAIKDEVAEIAGVPADELTIELCEGANASISPDGGIGVGKELLEENPDDELWVAILGHEIGHAPWSWPKLDLSHLSKAARDALYREEEAKADRFAGRVLAELGVSPERICEFLIAAEAFEAHPPTDYYPAPVRAEMIRSAFRRRAQALAQGRAIFGGAGRLRDLR